MISTIAYLDKVVYECRRGSSMCVQLISIHVEQGFIDFKKVGSVAGNEAASTSDVDLLVEFHRPVGYFGLFALQDYLEKLPGCHVDLGTPDSLKPYIKERMMGELIRVAQGLAKHSL